MKLSDLFDYEPYFRSKEKILRAVKNSKKYSQEDLTKAEIAKFFQTSKQRTYLVKTEKMIYCVLDDRRKDQPIVSWSEPLEEFVIDDEVRVSLTTSDRTETTGVINFGPKHNNWLYSKTLFSDQDITQAVEHLLKKK